MERESSRKEKEQREKCKREIGGKGKEEREKKIFFKKNLSGKNPIFGLYKNGLLAHTMKLRMHC